MILRSLFIVSLVFCLGACTNKQKESLSAAEQSVPLALRPTADKQAKMIFEQPLVYFGRIQQGDSVMHTYHFKNTGNMPLKITSVNASCGCTTPKWSQDLVQPGKRGFIKVKFDSRGKEGKTQKTITVYANTVPADNTVAFKVEILPKK